MTPCNQRLTLASQRTSCLLHAGPSSTLPYSYCYNIPAVAMLCPQHHNHLIEMSFVLMIVGGFLNVLTAARRALRSASL
jgi:hypothetical protein